MNAKQIFALTYLGHLFGEAMSVTEKDGGAAFYHESMFDAPDGHLLYAVYYRDGVMEINPDLPTYLFHQVVGYCALNNIPWEELI